MFNLAKKFDRWLHSHIFLLLALALLLALRIPSFFEPYWYGDEGIYLTIGNAIRSGERLYTDIVDHKTPIIYFLAAVPTQLCFRFLTAGWMIISTIAFYSISKKLFKKKAPIAISTLVFVFLTSVPWFEGNIPNGELFVMGFVLVGAWIMSKTKIFENFLLQSKKSLVKIHDPIKLYLTGTLFGLAILTKVPGLFDVAAWLAVFWFIATNQVGLLSKSKTKWLKLFKKTVAHLLIVILGVVTPILISIIYFVAIGSGQDYLQFGLLYNFHYAANWGLPFQNVILEQLFTLPGKVSIAALIYFVLTLKTKWFKPRDQIIFGWFILALVGALLSNRPYPHYFQQLVPALALLLGNMMEVFKSKKAKVKNKVNHQTAMGLVLIVLFVGALRLLDFGAYPLWSYYQKFYGLVAGKITRQEYRQSFNYFMDDNYKAAEIIKQSGVNEIFIWGTNPMLYALTETNPTGKFTVSFHIKDLKVYEETLESMKNKKPLFVVVMEDEDEELPGLDEHLQKYYVLNSNFTHFSLWKRLPELVSLGTL